MSNHSGPQREPKAVSGPLAPIHFSKELFNTPSLNLYPSIFHFILLSLCLPFIPYPPLWLPLSLYSSITLSYIHPSFDLCPYSCPCIHDRVYKALNLRDYLHRFPLLSPTPFSSLHASFTLHGCFFLYDLNSPSPSCGISFSFSLHLSAPAVCPSVNNPSAHGGIARLTEKTQSFLFTLSEVIYAVRWRVCPWLKQLNRRRKGRRPETAREDEPRSCLSCYAK